MNLPPILPDVRARLRRDTNCIGLGMLFLLALSMSCYTAAVILLALFGVIDPAHIDHPTLGLDNTGYLLIYGVVYIIMMGAPMLLAALIFREKAVPFRPHGPVSLWRGILWLLCGMGLCLVANYIANLLMMGMMQLGIPIPETPDLLEATPLSLVLNIVVFAVLPALLEEMFFRGYVFQMLRRYNDTGALLLSALLFGLMHGNVHQIPFAFMVGLVLGFIVLRTDNIWLAVGVHFLNNTMSTLLSYMQLLAQNEAEQAVQYYVLTGLLLLIGLVSGIVLLVTRRRTPRPEAPRALSAGQTFAGGLFRSPLLLLSVVAFVLFTVLATVTDVLEHTA